MLPPPVRAGVIILAAGRSSRMGCSKLLLPWKSGTVLQQLIVAWREVGAVQVAVVWSKAAEDVKRELQRLSDPGVTAIENLDVNGEMWSSIQCAARWDGWQTGLTHFCLSLGDQPQIKTETLVALLEFAGESNSGIIQPQFQAKLCHPVIFSADWRKSLAGARHETLREFLHAHASFVKPLNLNDPGLAEDLDSAEDYERISLRVFGKAGTTPGRQRLA